MPFPSYIHALQLSLDIWDTPTLQIMTPFINDVLETGREYNYEIKVKNTGNEPIKIDPQMSSDNNRFYGAPGQIPPAFTDDAINITAPSSVPPGKTEIIKINVKVPANARGSYNGGIKINADDPAIRDWEGIVQISFNVWTQPTEAYVKKFSLKKAEPVTIEISSGFGSGYPYPVAMTTNKKEPSFETTLIGPSGKVELAVTKTVIKGAVNMGGEKPPWEQDSLGIYQDSGVQFIETYKTNGSPGEWELKVLPNNTERFEYTIMIGE